MPNIKNNNLNSPISVRPQVFNTPLNVNSSFGGKAEWGHITGTLSDQTDLQTALNAKMDKAGGTFTGDVTLDSDVSLKTTNGRLHEVNNKIVLGDDSNNGLYVTPNGQTAALVNGNTVKNIITSSDVKSTYSSTGVDPVNGTAVASAISGKQDTLTQTQLNAVNSGIDSTKVGQIATNTSDITTIEGKIPAQATSLNQLADKNFVNSSIATNTANFIGTFNSVAELEAYAGTLTNNDYAFVVGTDSDGNTVYNRYKYTTATTPASWVFEYALNNSSFTAAQWAAINSGITDTAVTQIGTNTTNIGTLTTDKQPKTLATPITVEGTSQTTVESALGAINTLAGKGLQNQATGTGSLSILSDTTADYRITLGAPYVNNSTYCAVGIGSFYQAAQYGTSLGFAARAGQERSVAIGYGAYAKSSRSIAIGPASSYSGTTIPQESYCAVAKANAAIQIGAGSNSTANTLQVYSYQLLDASGKIPNARLNLDSALDTSSTNPVENQAVANALNSKLTYAMIIREW